MSKASNRNTILLSFLVLCGTSLVSSFASFPLRIRRFVSQKDQALQHQAVPRGGGGTSRSSGSSSKDGNDDANAAAAELSRQSKTQELLANEAASLFGNLRIPAALFAGAAAGAAFALPLVPGEGLRLGMVKRVYALCMVGALSSQVIAIVVATVTVAALSSSKSTTATATAVETASVAEYLRRNCDLEWVTARFHFLSGLLLFAAGSGLRAWVTIGCPVIAKAALGIVASATLLALAFIDAAERDHHHSSSSSKGVAALPGRFVRLLARRAKRRDEGPWFAAAAISALVTAVYLASKLQHVYRYLVLTTGA